MATDSPATPDTPAGEAPPRPADIERLFREHNEALLRFIAAKLGSEQEAREVAQEAYVRLLSLHKPEAVSYLRAFLYKTAANLAFDRLRQRARRGYVRTQRDAAERAVFELSPERLAEDAETLQTLRTALEELPEKCRRAFLLHRLEDLSCAEIAQRLGLRERMVRMYVARAVEYLRTRLDRMEHEGSRR